MARSLTLNIIQPSWDRLNHQHHFTMFTQNYIKENLEQIRFWRSPTLPRLNIINITQKSGFWKLFD